MDKPTDEEFNAIASKYLALLSSEAAEFTPPAVVYVVGVGLVRLERDTETTPE
jgi:hypothetical protein